MGRIEEKRRRGNRRGRDEERREVWDGKRRGVLEEDGKGRGGKIDLKGREEKSIV